ncbi:hypothetical protein VTO42DRAFT_5469 [Malbranchea cinnamomea]
MMAAHPGAQLTSTAHPFAAEKRMTGSFRQIFEVKGSDHKSSVVSGPTPDESMGSLAALRYGLPRRTNRFWR